MKNSLLIFTTLFLFLFSSCKTYHNAIALDEIDQGMSSQDEYRLKSLSEKKIPPAIGMIREIEILGGEQKYLFVTLGTSTKGFRRGLYGYIYNDPQMTQKVGTCRIIEVYTNVSRAEVIELNYKIEYKGVVMVEVDPRYHIKPPQ